MSSSSFMEYLYETHQKQLTKPCDYIALLCHSILLDKKLKLKSGKALLPDNWNLSDPIRLIYLNESNNEIHFSVVETSGDIFINLTESKSDGIGSIEISADDYVNTTPNATLKDAYPQMDQFIDLFNKDVWLKAFPPKLSNPNPKGQTSSLIDDSRIYHNNPFRIPGGSSLIDPIRPEARLPFDYGRADLDPFGFGNYPLGRGPGLSGPSSSGMLFDPRRNMPSQGPYPGAPDLAGPPGARIDPIYPGPNIPGNRGRGNRPPDPDMPHPPGWEDMYL